MAAVKKVDLKKVTTDIKKQFGYTIVFSSRKKSSDNIKVIVYNDNNIKDSFTFDAKNNTINTRLIINKIIKHFLKK